MKLAWSNLSWLEAQATDGASGSTAGTGTSSTSNETPSAPPEAPAAGAEPAAGESTAEEGDSSVDDWGSLGLNDDEEEGEEGKEPQAPPPEAPAKLAAEPPKAAPAAAEPPAQPPAEPPKAEPKAEEPVRQTPEQIEQSAREAAQRFESELVTYYKLPEDLAAQLETEPEVVLPKLAAKLHQTIMNAALTQLNAQLPSMISQVQQMHSTAQAAQDAFDARWPDLKENREQVIQIGKMFRQANPKATPQEAIERVGQMVYLAMGKPLPGAAAPAPAGTPQAGSATPAAPAAAAGFRPAMPGAGGPAAAPPKGGNEFENLAEEFLHEDS